MTNSFIAQDMQDMTKDMTANQMKAHNNDIRIKISKLRITSDLYQALYFMIIPQSIIDESN